MSHPNRTPGKDIGAERPMMDVERQSPYLTTTMENEGVERGLALTVDNSPRVGRNLSVIKAKLREQESRHTLDMVQMKKDYENRANQLQDELTQLRSYKCELELCLGKERQAKEELELVLGQERDDREGLEQRHIVAVADLESMCNNLKVLETKFEEEKETREELQKQREKIMTELTSLTGKCSALQGRLDECHAARDASRDFSDKLQTEHEETVIALRNELATIESRCEDKISDLRREFRDLELELEVAHRTYKKQVADQAQMLKKKEEEMSQWKLNQVAQEQQLLEEKRNFEAEMEIMQKNLMDDANATCDQLNKEIKQCNEDREAALEKMKEEYESREQACENNREALTAQLANIQEQLAESKAAADNAQFQLADSRVKYEESVKVLKETLTVIDQQNKELVNDVENLRIDYSKSVEVGNTMASEIDALKEQLTKAQREIQDMSEEKSSLAAELRVACDESEAFAKKSGEIHAAMAELEQMKSNLNNKIKSKDAFVCQLQEQLDAVKLSMRTAVTTKDDEIDDLKMTLKDLSEKFGEELLSKKEIANLLETTKASLENISLKYDCSQQHVDRLTEKQNQMYTEFVEVRKREIDLKADLDVANEQIQFEQQRNSELRKEWDTLKNENQEKEAELKADIEDKRRMMEYLQGQLMQEKENKKKRRFFGSKSDDKMGEASTPKKPGSPAALVKEKE